MRYHGIKEGFWCKLIQRPFMIQEASKLSGPSSTQRDHTAKLPVGSCFHTYATSGIAICPAPWSKHVQAVRFDRERGMKEKNMIETHTSHKVAKELKTNSPQCMKLNHLVFWSIESLHEDAWRLPRTWGAPCVGGPRMPQVNFSVLQVLEWFWHHSFGTVPKAMDILISVLDNLDLLQTS